MYVAERWAPDTMLTFFFLPAETATDCGPVYPVKGLCLGRCCSAVDSFAGEWRREGMAIFQKRQVGDMLLYRERREGPADGVKG
jgi:hypothetical protein